MNPTVAIARVVQSAFCSNLWTLIRGFTCHQPRNDLVQAFPVPLEFLQLLAVQVGAVWGLLGLVKQFLKRPRSVDYGSGWIDAETGQFMSLYKAIWLIVGLAGSSMFVFLIDWPVIAEWVPWGAIGTLPSNILLETSVQLYNMLFSAVSSAYRTVAAIVSVGVASVLNFA